jgi:Rrf2 family protein
MQLTRAADYAVRVMLHLARQPEGAVISKSNLALASGAPESFLSKILQAMARHGLIQARRGVIGGFMLLERGEQATLLDVVESIDGPVALNRCLASSCERMHECPAHDVWKRAQAAMFAVLGDAKIADMAAASGPGRKLVKIARADHGSAQKSKAPSRQLCATAKPKRKASSAASGARGTTGSRRKK